MTGMVAIMRQTAVLLAAVIGGFVPVGARTLSAQEPPAAIRDPISPADCLRDKSKVQDCANLGAMYGGGRGVPKDVTKGLAYLDAACRQQRSDACHAMGVLLLERHESPEDAKKGVKLLEQACRERDDVGCGELGRCYAEGIGVPRDAVRAMRILEPTCAANAGRACWVLANLLERGDGVARDADRAAALTKKACASLFFIEEACEKACASGDTESCLVRGDRLSRRKPLDVAAVDRAYGEACSAGGAQDWGCYSRALSLRVTGQGARAVVLHEKACTAGHAWSCASLADAHYIGRGVAANPVAAARFYRTACEGGAATACVTLGGMCARGELGAEEAAMAPGYFAIACGDDTACKTIVAGGNVPEAWGGNLEALRPSDDPSPGKGSPDQSPKLVRQTKPHYPPYALDRRVGGRVQMELLIDPRGAVGDVRYIGGPYALREAAMECVRQWTFEPARHRGLPVPAVEDATVTFDLY